MSKMIIVAGQAVYDRLQEERRSRVSQGESLPGVQEKQFASGFLGAEIVESNYGFSVRHDTGLMNWGLIASSRSKEVDGTVEDAERAARDWVARDPDRRYAWRRK
jgi:hypothetical protein